MVLHGRFGAPMRANSRVVGTKYEKNKKLYVIPVIPSTIFQAVVEGRGRGRGRGRGKKIKKSVDSFHISFLEKSFGSVSGRVC